MVIFTNDYLANIPGSKMPAGGGTANFAKRFNAFLSGKGHHWIGLAFKFPPKEGKVMIRKEPNRLEGRDYYVMSITRIGKTLGRARRAFDPEKVFEKQITAIAKLLRKTEADVVFLNGYMITNWLILKAAQKENVPVAMQHAGILSREIDMYKEFFTATGRKLMKDMEREVSEVVDAEIFLNDWSRRYYEKHVTKTHRSRTKIIPLPVDFKNYCRSKEKKNGGQINIGIIARWDRIKNHEAVATMAEEARKSGLPWKFHSVTVIPDSKKKARLKNRYRKNVEIVPPLDQKGIEKFCHRMDLLILPSHFDVSPNVVLEAVGCGTPIAISENVGFVDAFRKHDAKDWIINFNDPVMALRKINGIMGREMPAKLRKSLKSDHDSTKIFNRYVRLFREIIKNHENRPAITSL